MGGHRRAGSSGEVAHVQKVQLASLFARWSPSKKNIKGGICKMNKNQKGPVGSRGLFCLQAVSISRVQYNLLLLEAFQLCDAVSEV